MLLGMMEAASDSGAVLEIIDSEGSQIRRYSDLLASGERCAAMLADVGVAPGSRIGAIANTSFDFVVALLGTWYAGCAFVPLPPPTRTSGSRWRSELSGRLERIGIDRVLLGEDDRTADLGGKEVRLSAESREKDSQPAPADPAHPALIQFSSGTTGRARAAALSHQALAANFRAKMERIRSLGPDLHAVSWLPLYHDLGLIIYLLHPLASGMSVTLLATDLFVRDPLSWLRLIGERNAALSSAPNFAYGLAARRLASASPDEFDLSSWRHATLGGEFIDPAVLTSFEEQARRFGFPDGALAPGYGLAEATCTVTVLPPGERYVIDEVDRRALTTGRAEPATSSSTRRTSFVSVGPPLIDTQIRINGGSEGAAPDRHIGEILIKAPYLMSGYLDDPAATAAVLDDGWLRTGDLGYLVGDDLFVTGRLKDVVVVRGQNFHAEDVERVLQQVPGVRAGGVAILPGSQRSDETFLVAAESRLVDEHERSACRREIERRVWAEIGVAPGRVLLVPPGSLPKTSSGKLRRQHAAELVQQEALVEP